MCPVSGGREHAALVFDRTLALEVTGSWQGASGQADIRMMQELEYDRTLGCVRSHATGRVRSRSVPYCKRPDAEGPVSGQLKLLRSVRR